MLQKTFAQRFAIELIEAWNSHDLERIFSHYSDDFEMSSPVIAQIGGEPSGKLKGKKAVSAYWARAFSLIPTLHFDLISVHTGVDSVTLCYTGPRGVGAEVFIFNASGKVVKAFAHYT